MFSRLLDIFFPRECTGCRTLNTLLCEECLMRVPPASPAEHSFIRAVFDYKNKLIKRAVWRFKYKNARGFAEVFAPYLCDEIVGTLGEGLYASERAKFLIIPIPLHNARLRERGYNQSELLAQAVIKLDHGGIFELASNVLVRTRKTKPQAHSEKRAVRIENLRDAFSCTDYARVRGRTVILLDDVTTTGATLLAAKQALTVCKPRKVLAFTVAH